MSKITATFDGTECEVDLTKVSGLDAMQFRMETGQDIDLTILGMVEKGEVLLLADLAVAKWLWIRQTVDPLATFALVAASVTLFEAEAPTAVEV